jgi:aryl-alcohol dehydrogenase-like predicted oxidoreductase
MLIGMGITAIDTAAAYGAGAIRNHNVGNWLAANVSFKT